MGKKIRRVVICGLMLVCLLSACGKKDDSADGKNGTSVKTADENAVNVVDNSNTASIADESQPVDATQKYEEFLSGNEKVYTDKYEFSFYDTEGKSESYYKANNGYSIEEFFAEILEVEAKGYDDAPIDSVEYAFIDCGADGEPELALRARFNMYPDQLTREYVIKNVDGKLELTYQDSSYYRSFVEISNEYGKIHGTGSYSAAQMGESIGYLNKDGRYENCYNVTISYYGAQIMDERFQDGIINSDIDISDLYLRVYSFNTDSEDSATSLDDLLYCAEKEDDDESNGINFAENVRKVNELGKAANVKIYSLDEIKQLIANKESQLGISEVAKDDNEINWSELDINVDKLNGFEEITVDNADELMSAIGNKRVILLNPGTYDIGKWVETKAANSGLEILYTDESDLYEPTEQSDNSLYYYDELNNPCIALAWLSDCKFISADKSNPAIITSSIEDTDILYLYECNNISFENISFKNSDVEGMDSQFAINIKKCNTVILDSCEIAAPWSHAMSINQCYGTQINDCNFHDCHDGFMEVWYSYSVDVTDSHFSDSSGAPLLHAFDSVINMNKCDFHDNEGVLMYESSSNNIYMNDCAID